MNKNVTYDNIISTIKEANISFAKGIFYAKVKDVINEQLNYDEELSIINDPAIILKFGITEKDKPALLNFLKNSNITINKGNADFYIPIALSNLKNSNLSYSNLYSSTTNDLDFAVNYYGDASSTMQFIKENIVCAAQLYYVMTLGDELEIFNVINRIVTRYLPSGKVDIRSKETLQNLQLYVFSENFRDLKDGSLYKKTLPEERKMFYTQVFNVGNGQTLEGMAVNSDFNMLWEILMSEVVKYIDKIERSENPQLFVSRQNIFQAIEDLQYNLSAHCTGMAKVVAPVINKELDFVIEKFLKNEEIIQQLAFSNSGSFWKVIERVLQDMRSDIPNVTALRNKAVSGHKIITTIANYTPALLDNDTDFSAFISTVEAFIIANSQLENQRMPMEDLEQITNGIPGMNGHSQENDDWNF